MPDRSNFPAKTRRYKRLSDQERQHAIDRYELGLDTIEGIARGLDVHRNTIGGLLRRRGAIKGCRAHETVVDLRRELDATLRRRAHQQCLDDIRRLDGFIERSDVLGRFMDALFLADRDGELAHFGRAMDLCDR